MNKYILILILILIFILMYATNVFCQNTENKLYNILRINMLNPGLELELPISNKSTLAINSGIGISGSYPKLSNSINGGFFCFVAPFVDLSYKYIYNIDSRLSKGKNILGNSGNYFGFRLLSNLSDIYSYNVVRNDNIDFIIGPTWGIQRNIRNIHFLFDLGPVYYVDSKGNNGFYPIALQLNIGFDLRKW
jgi:hypothetical protein